VRKSLDTTTLLWHVPILLALAHQSVAVVALIVATVHAANLRANKTTIAAAPRDRTQLITAEHPSAA
jgi:heme A synthase